MLQTRHITGMQIMGMHITGMKVTGMKVDPISQAELFILTPQRPREGTS